MELEQLQSLSSELREELHCTLFEEHLYVSCKCRLPNEQVVAVLGSQSTAGFYLLSSLVPRPHPLSQCYTLRKGKAWYATSRT